MSKNRFSKTLSWDDFQSMGDKTRLEPDQVDVPQPEEHLNETDTIRLYKEKKGRKGKTVSIVKGLSLSEEGLEDLCKKLKTSCGVGGQVENTHIVLQGDQRDRIQKILTKLGYNNVKKAGG